MVQQTIIRVNDRSPVVGCCYNKEKCACSAICLFRLILHPVGITVCKRGVPYSIV